MNYPTPLPPEIGLGFNSLQKPEGYDSKISGRYHNHHFTTSKWQWPEPYQESTEVRVVDGFSPNLNKQLHVGHLRNLALANAFSKIFPKWQFVSLLGTSLGVYNSARQNLAKWFDFLGYSPEFYYDALMPWDEDLVPRKPGKLRTEGCQVWTENEDVILIRSDGRPTYAFHDLGFAATVAPDYYITGCEQIEHFANLGLGDKHLPMGLVLGKDGKKLKSRDGEALSAQEAVDTIKVRLRLTPTPDKLAWNILCWNFLRCSRTKNVTFDPDRWVLPDSPGLYISYTYARLKSALNRMPTSYGLKPTEGPLTEKEVISAREVVREIKIINNIDLKILANMEYSHYWLTRSAETLDTAPLANYLHDLCRILADGYTKERIVDGRRAFQAVVLLATERLGYCMQKLGMFTLEEV